MDEKIETNKLKFYSRMRWNSVVEDLREFAQNNENVFFETEPTNMYGQTSVGMMYGNRWFNVMLGPDDLISYSGFCMKTATEELSFYRKINDAKKIDWLPHIAKTWLLKGIRP